MQLFNVMNELVKQDISDILQVNIPGWFTVGYIWEWFSLNWLTSLFASAQQAGLEQVNETVQNTGASVIVILTIFWTVFKIYRGIEHYRWNREERYEEMAEESKE